MAARSHSASPTASFARWTPASLQEWGNALRLARRAACRRLNIVRIDVPSSRLSCTDPVGGTIELVT
jgi:hypothetical protein